MTDQFEIYDDYIYSGSYTNDILLPFTNKKYGIKQISTINLSSSLNYKFRPCVGSSVSGITNPTYQNVVTAFIPLGSLSFLFVIPPTEVRIYGYNTPLLPATFVASQSVQLAEYTASNISVLSDVYRFTEDVRSSVKKFTTAIDFNEIFVDSIMPDMSEIYYSGTVDQNQNYPITFTMPGQNESQQILAEHMLLCTKEILTSSYYYIKFNSATEWEQMNIGNYNWPYEYPFENKYKNIQRSITTDYRRRTSVSNSFLDTMGLLRGYVSNYTGSVGGPGRSYWIYPPTALPYFPSSKPREVGLSIAYGGLISGSREFNSNGTYPSVHSTKSLTVVADISMSLAITGSGLLADVINITGSNTWTSTDNDSLYFHFFGFGDYLGKFVDGFRSVSGSAVNSNNVINWNWPGPTFAIVNNATSQSQAVTYEYQLITSSLISYKPRGYKYGCYKPINDNSKIIFRQGKYGQYRDMLEQRQYTKFYGSLDNSNNKTILVSPVKALFSTGSSYAITGASDALNLRTSGIYDIECRSGQPFFDVDTGIR